MNDKTDTVDFHRHFCAFILIALAIFSGCNTPGVGPQVEKGPPWIVYTTSNSLLTSNIINAITMDRSGNVWLATDEGACKSSGRSWYVITDPLEYIGPSGVSRKVSAVSTADEGSVWFGLAGGGVRRFNPSSSNSTWTSYTVPSLRSNIVFAIAVDASGSVWVGTANGVSRFLPGMSNPSDGLWLGYSSSNSTIPDEVIRCIGVNPNDNSIWFGTTSQGVASYDGDVNWDITSPTDAPFPFLSMSFSPGNIGWFGTYADWAYQYAVKSLQWAQYGDSAHGGRLPDRFVNAVVARNGVWFGTNKGLVKVDGSHWKTYNTRNSPLPSDTVRAPAFDFHKNLWIGTANGVAEFSEGGINTR